jgi:hypothetical protein
MKALRISTALAIAIPLAISGCGRSESLAPPTSNATQTPPPTRTGAVRKLLYAQPFTVATPYAHMWRREKPQVSSGWILVIEVDPAMTEPHQSAMPVLLAGEQTAEPVNFGQPSGNVVAVVPGAIDESNLSVWFGPPDLPETVDGPWITLARAKAPPENVTTFTTAEVAAARALGGPSLSAADRVAIDRSIAQLILRFSPEERQLAESLLVPVLK